jgi:predicted HicB family RNase H-like nuclease
MDDLLPYKNFSASVHFSAEDGAFYGKLIGIDDLVRFEGCSVSELTKSFHEAVDDYLETCRRLGKAPTRVH